MAFGIAIVSSRGTPFAYLTKLVCEWLNTRVLGTEFRVLERYIFSDRLVGVGGGMGRRVRVCMGSGSVQVDLFSSLDFSSPVVWRVFEVADPDFYDGVVGFILDGDDCSILGWGG